MLNDVQAMPTKILHNTNPTYYPSCFCTLSFIQVKSHGLFFYKYFFGEIFQIPLEKGTTEVAVILLTLLLIVTAPSPRFPVFPFTLSLEVTAQNWQHP